MRVLLCIVISLSGDHSLYTFDLVYLLLFFPEEPRVPTSYNLHNHIGLPMSKRKLIYLPAVTRTFHLHSRGLQTVYWMRTSTFVTGT